jgi:gamma-glutamyl hercynylcysteine S-oxide synthase
VTLTKGYWIDKTEVTNQAFQAFVQAGGYTTRSYWSDKGWEWLQGQFVDQLPRF